MNIHVLYMIVIEVKGGLQAMMATKQEYRNISLKGSYQAELDDLVVYVRYPQWADLDDVRRTCYKHLCFQVGIWGGRERP